MNPESMELICECKSSYRYPPIYLLLLFAILIFTYEVVQVLISAHDMKNVGFVSIPLLLLILVTIYAEWLPSHPKFIKLYSDGLEIRTCILTCFVSTKSRFIPFSDIVTIYPGYIPTGIVRRNLEENGILLSSFTIILINKMEYTITDKHNENAIKMLKLLRLQIGDRWKSLFDEFYKVKNIPEKHFIAFKKLQEDEKIPYGEELLVIYPNLLLCSYYEKVTGEKVFPDYVRPLKKKYLSLWKNVESFPSDFDEELNLYPANT